MLMTQVQYAQHAGISQPAVSKRVRRGDFALVDGRIDSDQADAVLAISRGVMPTLVAAAPSIATAPVGPSPALEVKPIAQQQPSMEFRMPLPGTAAAEQAALARVRREQIEMRMAAQRGEYLPAAPIEQAWGEITIAIRNRLLLIADSITDQALRARIDREIRQALDDLSRLPVIEEASAA